MFSRQSSFLPPYGRLFSRNSRACDVGVRRMVRSAVCETRIAILICGYACRKQTGGRRRVCSQGGPMYPAVKVQCRVAVSSFGPLVSPLLHLATAQAAVSRMPAADEMRITRCADSMATREVERQRWTSLRQCGGGRWARTGFRDAALRHDSPCMTMAGQLGEPFIKHFGDAQLPHLRFTHTRDATIVTLFHDSPRYLL